MNANELKEYLKQFVESENKIGVESYAVIKKTDGSFDYQFLVIKQSLCDKIKHQFINELNYKLCVLSPDIKNVKDIADNKNDTYYIFESNDIYDSISFIYNADLKGNHNAKFKISDDSKLLGFLFKIGNDDNCIIIYQHYYPTARIKVGHSIVLTEDVDDNITDVKHDMIRINKSIDIIFIEGCLYTANIKLLERSFGYKTVIINSAKPAVDFIKSNDIVSDIEKSEKYIYAPNRLNKLKKLMQADSKILSMKKEDIFSAIKSHRVYKHLLQIENDRIVIKKNADIDNLIQLLSDSVLTSEITNYDYSVDVKEKYSNTITA